MTAALILGGGAPNLTLMSGALTAFKERNAQFSAISASGAGMLVALLYAAPKLTDPEDPAFALRNTRNMGVVDPINVWFPFNYKVFQKTGVLADWYRKALNPFLNRLPQTTFAEQWANDLAWFAAAAINPSDLWPLSGGLSAPAPWIEDVVDFAELKRTGPDFYINAYNLDKQEMQTFERHEIEARHFRAGLAFPFIYPPFKLEHKGEESNYIEGSAVDTFNFEELFEKFEIHKDKKVLKESKVEIKKGIKRLVVFDIIGRKRLLHAPTNLYDAWVQSIMVPLVAMARDDLRIFEDKYKKKHGVEVDRIEFDEDKIDWKNALSWSRSNLEALFDIGYAAGREFCGRSPYLFEPEAESSDARPDLRVVPKAW